MKIVAAMTVIVLHVLQDIDHSMKKGYAVVANKFRHLSATAVWEATTTPCYYCDHGHLRDQYEDQYQIIATTLNAEDKNVVKNIVDGQKRWRKVIIEAMEMQQARHYKQSLNSRILEDDDNQSVDVQVCHFFRPTINDRNTKVFQIILKFQILKVQCSTQICTQIFVVLYNNEPIPAEIVVSDLSLLSFSRISARLRIPVESITTLLPIGNGESQWWIVAVVIGIAASIIAIGWLCLFVYYNSCGRPYAKSAEKPLIHTIFLKDKFIQTAESNNGGKCFDVQPRDTENNKKNSFKTITTENDSLSRIQKAMEDDASAKDVASKATVKTASASITKQYVTTVDTDQQFDYPISIITRPRRREDLRIHKLESLSDISAVPTLKEICMEEKLHPHPIPPTVSGILEVRSLTEQLYRNPMNCL
uniref:DUF4793 domain-containing protein n=1 Tax=Elaeophora elaphi TaxID=1147741 RepID=A0A0R3S4H2_9BILA